jgi:hypothetical protein
VRVARKFEEFEEFENEREKMREKFKVALELCKFRSKQDEVQQRPQ